MVGAYYMHGMQWCSKTSGSKYKASTQHECGALQIIRHKMVDITGARSTVLVRPDLPYLE